MSSRELLSVPSEFSIQELYQRFQAFSFRNKERYEENKRALHSFINELFPIEMKKKVLKEVLFEVGRVIRDLRIVQDVLREERVHVPSKPSEGETSGERPTITLRSLIERVHFFALHREIRSFRVSTARLDRFRSIVDKVRVIGKGLYHPKAKALEEMHWLEAVGIRMEIEEKEYQGNLYLAYFHAPSHPYFLQWKTGCDEHLIPYHEKYSFSGFVKEVIVPRLSPPEKQALESACQSVVSYLGQEELETLKVRFDSSGKVYITRPFLNRWVENPTQARNYREFLKTQPLTPEGMHYVKEYDDYIYVLSTDEELFITIKQQGTTQHTSLSGGKAVLAAGKLGVDKDGYIVSVNTLSGHYRAGSNHLLTMLEFLSSKGVEVNNVQASYREGERKVASKELIPAGTVLHWMEEKRRPSPTPTLAA